MYDFLLETLYAIYRNGFSLSALGAVVYVLAKQRKVKKRLRQFIPWLLEDDSEVKGYVQNQLTIMENQKLIMERMGIECAPTLETSSEISVTKRKDSSQKRVTTLSPVQLVKKFMKYGGKKMKKFKSRKFILAVVGAALIIANDGLDLGIDSETVLAFAGLLATWIVGESAVDAKRVANNKDGSDYHH